MVALLLTLVLGFVGFDAVGYAVHWVMHRRWAGPLWRVHQAHHREYVPRRMVSDAYHGGASSRTTVAVWAVVVCALGIVMWLCLPLRLAAPLFAEAVAFAFVSDWIHDATHVREHRLDRYRWFRHLRAAHAVHHANQRLNLGIISFVMDRVVGTYRD